MLSVQLKLKCLIQEPYIVTAELFDIELQALLVSNTVNKDACSAVAHAHIALFHTALALRKAGSVTVVKPRENKDN